MIRRLFHVKSFAIFAMLAGGLGIVSSAATPPMVLEDVLLIDGTGAKPKPHQSIVIEDGKIARIVAGSHVTDPPAGAQVIRLSGEAVMPGIINGHGHLGLTKGSQSAAGDYTTENIASQLSQYERYGVTTMMSLGVNKDLLYRIREMQDKGQIGGASILTADHGIGTAGGAPKMNVEEGRVYRPKTAAEARADVDQMAAHKPDLIKVWVDDNMHTLPEPNSTVYGAAIAEAHKDGLRAAAHVFYQADATKLLDDKVDILAHSIRDSRVSRDTVRRLKQQQVYYIPTLELEEAFFVYAEHAPWMNDEFFKQGADPALLEMLNSDAYHNKVETDPTTAAHKAALRMALKNLKTLHRARVMVAFGTDSGAFPQRVQGFAEHRELQLMVEGGFKPLEAIHSATEVTAEMLHIQDRTGSVVVGKQADLLVLDGDPSKDIRNTEKIKMVLHAGQIVKTGLGRTSPSS